MKERIDNSNLDLDVTVLGMASSDTHGPGVGAEDFGTPIEQGISHE